MENSSGQGKRLVWIHEPKFRESRLARLGRQERAKKHTMREPYVQIGNSGQNPNMFEMGRGLLRGFRVAL
jgi:hypothetical protein